MTRDEAKARAIAAGIPEADITDADLAAFGYEAPDPTADMTSAAAPAVSDDQVKQDVADAQTEAAGNTTGAQVLQGVEKAAGIAGTLLGPAAKIP